MESKIVKLEAESKWDGKYPAPFEWVNYIETEDKDLIVLFTGGIVGTVLVASGIDRKVGEVGTEFIPCKQDSWRWLPPREIVTLNN